MRTNPGRAARSRPLTCLPRRRRLVPVLAPDLESAGHAQFYCPDNYCQCRRRGSVADPMRWSLVSDRTHRLHRPRLPQQMVGKHRSSWSVHPIALGRVPFRRRHHQRALHCLTTARPQDRVPLEPKRLLSQSLIPALKLKIRQQYT